MPIAAGFAVSMLLANDANLVNAWQTRLLGF
jgi:hypothetical protein